jgi:ethanolamine ammonia-lyase large subunit
MAYGTTINNTRWSFAELKTLLAKASPARSGDALAGLAASSAIERVAAQMALADLPLKEFLNVAVILCEDDEVTRLIVESHDPAAFAAVSHLTVGGFREWLLDERTTTAHLTRLAPGLTPEMVAAVARTRPDRGRGEVRDRHCLPQHDRAGGATLHAPAAQSSNR